MGTIVNALSLSHEPPGSSYLESGASAVRNCLVQNSSQIDEVGMLINTGVYRDRHIHEPSIASLIQGNLQKSFDASLAGTFSFDLHNGGGGVVMALSIMNGFIESGKINQGIVVAGDSEPFDGSAGAVGVANGRSCEGFQAFSQDTYLAYSSDFISYSNYSGNQVQIHIKQDDKYLRNCLQCACKSVDGFIRKTAKSMEDIDLIISSQSPEGFASNLAQIYGTERVLVLSGDRSYYSAGVIVALSQAQSRGLLGKSAKVLLINVGPGITVDLALYTNSP